VTHGISRDAGPGAGLIYATHGNEFSTYVGIERCDHFKTLLQLCDGSGVY